MNKHHFLERGQGTSDSELLLESRKYGAKRVSPEQGCYPKATEKWPGAQCTQLPSLCRPQAATCPEDGRPRTAQALRPDPKAVAPFLWPLGITARGHGGHPEPSQAADSGWEAGFESLWPHQGRVGLHLVSQTHVTCRPPRSFRRSLKTRFTATATRGGEHRI